MKYQWSANRDSILKVDDLGNVKLLEAGTPEYEAALVGEIEDPKPITFDRSPTSHEVRSLRDDLLASTDWTQIVDAPVNKDDWAAYRQALRDVPEQAGFPDNVSWPTAPI